MSFLSLLRRPFQYARSQYGHPFRLATTTVKTLFVAHLFWEYGYAYSLTWGPSMLPTFEVSHDGFIVSRWYRRGRHVKVGDVVAFDSVVEPGEKVIKRVLGLEGDYVMIHTPGSGSDSMIQLPQGHCWVVGDNLPASRDSRTFGPMPMALITGKIIAKVTPFSERRWIVNNLQAPQLD